MLRVFVSSRMQELAAERAAVAATLREMGVEAFVFEDDAGARPGTIVNTYREELVTSDVYLGLFWLGYGDYTNDEYRAAAAAGLPCLVYEKPPGAELRRDPELASFLERIGHVEDGDVTVAWFDDVDELTTWVRRDIERLRDDAVRRQIRSGGYVTRAGPHGVRLDAEPPPVIKVRRPHVSGCAQPPDPLLGRDRPLGRIRGALSSGERLLGFRGAPGMGKSALVASLAAELGAGYDDGAVCIQAADHASPRDVLQDIWSRYLDAGHGTYVATDSDLADGLSGRAALVTVDDLQIAAGDVEGLTAAMPQSSFVVTGAPSGDDLDALAYVRAVNLEGFTEDDDIVALFETDYGEPVPDEARAAVVAACRAAGAGPGQIRRLANDAWGSDARLADWATDAVAPPAPEQTRALRLVGAAGPAVAMPTGVAEALGISDEQLAVLEAAGLLKAASPRFRLAAPSTDTVTGSAVGDVAAIVAATAEWAGSADPEDVAASRAFVSWATERAAAAGDNEAVQRLARATSDTLATRGWWGAWERVLELAHASASAAGDPGGAGWALHQLGTRAEVLAGAGAGTDMLRRAVELRLAAGDFDGAALTQHNIAQIEANIVPDVSDHPEQEPESRSETEAEHPADEHPPTEELARTEEPVTPTQELRPTEVTTIDVPATTPVESRLAAGRPSWWRRGWVWAVAAVVGVITVGAIVAATQGGGGSGDIVARPDSVEFGDVAVGSVADAQTVTLTNEGDAGIDVVAIRLEGDGAPHFVLDGDCTGQLFEGGDCSLRVTFAPSAPGRHEARVFVDAGDDDLDVAVVGRATSGVLSTELDTFEFGTLAVGQTAEPLGIALINTGDGQLPALTVGLDQEGDAFTFDASGCEGQALAPDGQCTVILGFAAPGSGSFVAELVATAGTSTVNVTITGVGAFGELVADPETVDFDAVELSTTDVRELVLANSGDVGLTIESVIVDGAPGVTVDDVCSGVLLLSGESCSMSVAFTPTERGPITGAIVVATPDGETRIAVTGDGVAGDIEITPGKLDLGDVSIGEVSRGRFIVTNTGRGLLDVSASIDDGSGPFEVVGCESVQLEPGASCDLIVVFAPTEAGGQTGEVRVTASFAQGGAGSVLSVIGRGVSEFRLFGGGVGEIEFGETDLEGVLTSSSEELGEGGELLEWTAEEPGGCIGNGFEYFLTGLQLRFTDAETPFGGPDSFHFAQWAATEGSPLTRGGLAPGTSTLADLEAVHGSEERAGLAFDDFFGWFDIVLSGPDDGITFVFGGSDDVGPGPGDPIIAMTAGSRVCFGS